MNRIQESIAAVSCELQEGLLARDESKLPGGYRYHMFEGFTGWWTFCAQAGIIFERAHKRATSDDVWAEAVENFGTNVMKVIETGEVPNHRDLKEIAEKAVLTACELK